jgi:hypothetical protein
VERKGIGRKYPFDLKVRGIDPEWELLVHTPAVFVRVPNKGLAGYGTWKSVRRMEGEGA